MGRKICPLGALWRPESSTWYLFLRPIPALLLKNSDFVWDIPFTECLVTRTSHTKSLLLRKSTGMGRKNRPPKSLILKPVLTVKWRGTSWKRAFKSDDSMAFWKCTCNHSGLISISNIKSAVRYAKKNENLHFTLCLSTFDPQKSEELKFSPLSIPRFCARVNPVIGVMQMGPGTLVGTSVPCAWVMMTLASKLPQTTENNRTNTINAANCNKK